MDTQYRKVFPAGRPISPKIAAAVREHGRTRREVTRDEFLELRPVRSHDDELHCAWGAICSWEQDGKTFEEHQPDIGRVRFFITE